MASLNGVEFVCSWTYRRMRNAARFFAISGA
jgi:hypothetical protein